MSLLFHVKPAPFAPPTTLRRHKNATFRLQKHPVRAMSQHRNGGRVMALAHKPSTVQRHRPAGFGHVVASLADAEPVGRGVGVIGRGTASTAGPAVVGLLDCAHAADLAVTGRAVVDQLLGGPTKSGHATPTCGVGTGVGTLGV